MKWAELLKNRLSGAKNEFFLFSAISILLVLIQESFFLQLFNDTGPLVFLYFSNFVNKTWENCIFNIIMMWLGVILILISTNINQKKNFWYISLLFILIVSPFFISFINLLVITSATNMYTIGYSGIASIFLGYGFCALTISSYYFLDIRSLNNKKKGLFFILMGFFILLPIVNFVFLSDPIEISLLEQYGIINGVYQTFVQTKINIFIHVVGYLFGLFIPLILTAMFKLNLIEDQFSSSDFTS